MSDYADMLVSQATADGGRYQKACDELDEIAAERDNWLAEIDTLSIEQTRHMALGTLETLQELRRQMVEAINDEYGPKVREREIRVAYFERMGA